MINFIIDKTHSTNNSCTSEPKRSLTHADLNQFTGDLERFACSLNPSVIYTPGIRYLAMEGKAYWLIDAIASYYGTETMNRAILRDPRLQSLQFWRLDVKDQSAVLIAQADADNEPFIRQEITFTDFPLDHVEIWAGFDGNRWTLYLPSEH